MCKRMRLGLPSENLESAALQLPKPNTSQLQLAAAGGKQLQATFAGLLSTGVVRVHLMWGRWEAAGLPADLAAVVATFNAAGMNITAHIIERELYQRTAGPWRRVHNANYYSALRVAAAAAPNRMMLVLEDDVQLASFFALRLCRLAGQLQALVRRTLSMEQHTNGQGRFCSSPAAGWLRHPFRGGC